MAEVNGAVEHAAEMTAEKVHEIADAIPEVVESLTKVKVSFTALGLGIGAFVGSVIGWNMANKRLRKQYAEIAEEEISQMREHFRARLVAKETKPNLSAVQAKEIAETEGYTPRDAPEDPHIANVSRLKPPVPVPPGEPVTSASVETRNVFDEATAADAWDYEVEVAKRTPDEPYVIHVDERGEKEGYNTATLTYYAKDDVLCDEDDRVIHEDDGLVGREALNRFGHGSNDPSIVYVRNEHLEVELEIIKSPNSYAEEVHGFKHAEVTRRRRPRFPKWDD